MNALRKNTMPAFTIHPLDSAQTAQVAQMAELLVAAFAPMPDTWDTLEEAQEEVQEALEAGKLGWLALSADRQVIGWIGGFHAYAEVWELHPLAVLPHWQGQGVGTALIRALEAAVLAQGGLVMTLGTDDVLQQTSLSGKELYPHVWEHIRDIQNLQRHPYEFYQKQGYHISGLIPDANGLGKPDILMTKRLPR
jgi:aminoglycoside 6'-N-acetyltransferase I